MNGDPIDQCVAFLTHVLDEDERWARAASQTRDTGTSTGEHWQWECSNCDTVITPDPVLDEFIQCPECESYRVSLRSVEGYAVTGAPYTLPAFVISSAEEVPASVGGYLLRQSPARTLARVAATRRIIERFNVEARVGGSAYAVLAGVIEELAWVEPNAPGGGP